MDGIIDKITEFIKEMLQGWVLTNLETMFTDVNDKVERFISLDSQVSALGNREVVYRLSSKLPDFTKEAAQSSELGILQRAIKSGGRGSSLRKLFGQVPNLLPRLCPCMLMSPISAAQYIDPKRRRRQIAAASVLIFN